MTVTILAIVTGLSVAACVALFLFYRNVIKRTRRLLARQQRIHQDSARQFDASINNMTQALTVFDAEARLVVFNQRYLDMYGLPPDVVKVGCPLIDLLRCRKANGTFFGDPELYTTTMIDAIATGKTFETVVELNDGRITRLLSKPMPHGGWVATHEDITEQRRSEAKITHMAHHDALTGLSNRAHFHHLMDETLANMRRSESAAILCVDLDRFKQVNDSLGHPAGDRLLQIATARMQNCIGEHDLIARLGGDEFAVLQIGHTQPHDAIALATRLIDAMNAPFKIEGHLMNVGLSVGIAIAPQDGNTAAPLLKNADMALYRAKADGKGTYRFFESEMDASIQIRRALELDMRSALRNGDFELFYQPVVSVETQKLSGFEALLRWPHATRGMIMPNDFIPLAEQLGLIVPLGEWALQEACMQAARWPGDLHVAVNLSPVQFKNRNLVSTVVNALAHSGLSPQRLELEITETTLLQDEEATLADLHRLRDFGVRIAMDDFGTGYSSLSYLRSFPFDRIKIDRCFIKDVATRSDCLAIVRAVTGLAKSLGVVTTAEGVETYEQLEKISQAGCTEIQGYFYSPPRPLKDVPGLIGQYGRSRRHVA